MQSNQYLIQPDFRPEAPTFFSNSDSQRRNTLEFFPTDLPKLVHAQSGNQDSYEQYLQVPEFKKLERRESEDI